MIPKFYKGFTVYKKGCGPVFVTPHSGPSLETPTNRDDHSDTIASLCWLKAGGSLVVSNTTRKRWMGIDFNRDIPSEENALKMWNMFVKGRYPDKLSTYRKKYAWAAKNEKDHKNRKKVYKNFWATVKHHGSIFIFIHRKFTRLKNYPSIMDIITFGGKGIDNEIVRNIVKNINQRHTDFYELITEKYKYAVLLEEKRIIDRIKYIFGEFTLDKINESTYKTHLSRDIHIIKKYADTKFIRRLEKNFNSHNFIDGVKTALDNIEIPKTTVEKIFSGKRAYGPSKQLKLNNENLVIELECNQFIMYMYPNRIAKIILELIKGVKDHEKYAKIANIQKDLTKNW